MDLKPPLQLRHDAQGKPFLVHLAGCFVLHNEDDLASAIWAYAHSGFRGASNTRADAQRFHDWTLLSIAEIWHLVQSPHAWSMPLASADKAGSASSARRHSR
jgi:hypothetical protein